MPRSGPKESDRTRKALELHAKGHSVWKAASLAGVLPSTVYRALQRRKEKR